MDTKKLQVGNSETHHELALMMERLTHFHDESEKNAKILGESVLGLQKYWNQIHWYHALTGVFVTLFVSASLFGIYYYKSADRLLADLGVRMSVEHGNNGKRIVLSGKKVLSSGQTDTKVMVQFE